VPCPCPANKCGGSELLAAAMQQPKSNGKAGITPHVGRNRCTRCNTWLGRWSGQAHPCIPDEPGEHPPWPVPEVKATKPGVADDLSRSPSQNDEHRCETMIRESTSEDAAPPDFRPPAGGEVLPPLAEAKRHHLIALKVASSEYANSFVRRGLAYETRQDHANLFRRVAAAAEAQKPSGPTDEPAATWLMRLVRSWGRRRRWRWATMTSTMSSLQSAFKYLPAYMKTAQRWQLHQDANWQLASKTARVRAAAEPPDQPKAATAKQALSACRHATELGDHTTAAIIALSWVSTARSSSIVQIKHQDISILDDDRVQVTVMRGKSTRLGQPPHTVTTALGNFAPFILRALKQEPSRRPVDFVFPAPARKARAFLLQAVKGALRDATGDMKLENRSLRRGALQCLALAGAPLTVMLAFSGHSNVQSLKRYLNFGRIMPEENAKALPYLANLTQVVSPPAGVVC
jgi:hypothetical protein